jgi:DNA-binding response OmpR family regulator
MRVLVAEDDRTAQLLLRATLRSLRHDAEIVDDGQAALERLQKEAFPLLISDWMMPRLSGIELLRALRKQEARRLAQGRGEGYTYVVMLTALGGKESYLEGMDAGADDLITKPFETQQLAARIRVAERILGLLGRERQLSGLLPICSYCKRIRDEAGAATAGQGWVPVESYVSKRTEASFSHELCPECRAASGPA